MAAILQLAAGLGLLLIGGEALVRGASGLARRLGVSSLLIGLTVVAFGTSAPELAVSVRSAVQGTPGLALGNAVGSNIFNSLLILGVAAAVRPLRVAHSLVRLEAPLVIAASCLAWLFVADSRLSGAEGALLLLGMLAYVAWCVRVGGRQQARADRSDSGEPPTTATLPRRSMHLAAIGVGLLLLVLGSHWVVDGAVRIADDLGASPLVVGLTIVAMGTSLPELATSLVATRRGEQDIAVGNVMGSNLFNVLAILGSSAVLAPGGLQVPAAASAVDVPMMVATSVLCLVVLASGWRISRREGALFVFVYVVYATYVAVRVPYSDPEPVDRWIVLAVGALAACLFFLALGRRRRANG
ncbi:MAG: calcium/sodium antiporter [Gemmatimonadota bacterium]|nr:MAG: calcium/sodium antiporter [Gemmatimonadota bacterium]